MKKNNMHSLVPTFLALAMSDTHWDKLEPTLFMFFDECKLISMTMYIYFVSVKSLC